MEEKKGALGQTETAEAAEGAEQAAQKGFTRRQVVIGGVGIGLAGLIAGGALAKWGVVEESIASGRIVLDPLPQKMIITDRARCSGCQRCELMCSLRNDGRACQHTVQRYHLLQCYLPQPDLCKKNFLNENIKWDYHL